MMRHDRLAADHGVYAGNYGGGFSFLPLFLLFVAKIAG